MRGMNVDTACLVRTAGLLVLSFIGALACTSTTGGNTGINGSGGSATGSGGATTGGTGGGSSPAIGASGGTVGRATTGNGGSTGGDTGASSTGGKGAGGTATGGMASSGTGGSGTGGSGAGGKSIGATATGGQAGGQSGGGSGGVAAGGTSGIATGGAAGAGTSTSGAGGAAVADTVTRTTSTFAFKHFPIQTTSDGVWNGSSTAGTQASTTTYNTVVLENGYLKVTLLPDYGGRILSIVHKPTNTELLYQNPIGAPYLMLQGIFYYDYLVIMGGIFPSFPEPEHGKYWCQKYDLKVVSESKDAITVRMSRKDDLNVATGVPSKYDVGRTDVLVELDVTLRAGSTSLKLDTKLTNTQSKAIPKFEYWTNTTLAPGSTPGKTAVPLNTRIQAVTEQAHLLESQWSWFGKAEERISGEIFKWNNLSYFKNWVDQGIAYASPNYHANWSGLMNYDNNMGVVRVSDNVNTPGLKLWTFGPQGLTANINDSTQWVRPAIEMWHGVTAEFWTRGTMAASEVRQWTDSFFPTFGLKEVTAASTYGVTYLSSSKSGTDTVLSAAATLTVPKETVRAVLRLNGSSVAEQNVVVSAGDATTVSATVPTGKITSGASFEAEYFLGDTSLLLGKSTLQ